MKQLFWLSAVLLLAAAPAHARFIATDTDDDGDGVFSGYDSPGCASDIGGICTSYDLGFTANFGNGRTNKVYIYDDGQVSFGAPAGGGGAEFGPGSVAGSLRDPSVGGGYYRTAFFNRDGGAFNVQWLTCATPGSFNTDCFNFPDQIDLHIVPDYLTRTVTITLDTSPFFGEYEFLAAQFGYSLGSQVLPLTPLDGSSAFSISVPFGVPEPASWALMIAGFGLTGAALRRRRRLAVAA